MEPFRRNRSRHRRDHPQKREGDEEVSILGVGETLTTLAAASGPRARAAILADLFRRLHREEARYLLKLLVGELRIGLQEGLVESSIAKAFDQPLPLVRRAHMFIGDLGATALLARSGTLDSASMTLFHPIGYEGQMAREEG